MADRGLALWQLFVTAFQFQLVSELKDDSSVNSLLQCFIKGCADI